MDAVSNKNCAMTIQTPAAISCSGCSIMDTNARITAAAKLAAANILS